MTYKDMGRSTKPTFGADIKRPLEPKPKTFKRVCTGTWCWRDEVRGLGQGLTEEELQEWLRSKK